MIFHKLNAILDNLGLGIHFNPFVHMCVVAAGPVGRSGELAASVGSSGVAAVYSYSRSKGLFLWRFY